MNRGIIEEFLALAREREAAYGVYLAAREGAEADVFALLELEEYAAYEACEKKLMEALMALEHQELLDLEALMLSGRSPDPAKDFAHYQSYLAGFQFPPSERHLNAKYILMQEPLAQYWQAGLEALPQDWEES